MVKLPILLSCNSNKKDRSNIFHGITWHSTISLVRAWLWLPPGQTILLIDERFDITKLPLYLLTNILTIREVSLHHPWKSMYSTIVKTLLEYLEYGKCCIYFLQFIVLTTSFKITWLVSTKHEFVKLVKYLTFYHIA